MNSSFFFKIPGYIDVSMEDAFVLLNDLPSYLDEELIVLSILGKLGSLLAGAIVGLSQALAVQAPDTEKLSTYECGFEPYEDARNQFNIRFYIIAILFILFDIEILFMLPWCISISQVNLLSFWSMVEFLLELGIGFIYAWSVGAIEWE